MKYSFSAHFLKILPPATNFGDAWEDLCHDLLRCEYATEEIIRLLPPDHGVDILRRTAAHAYQCKSDERGALGTLPPGPAIESLTRAIAQRKSLSWDEYSLATNAGFSGDGMTKILENAEVLGLPKNKLLFKGPVYWSDLCERHFACVSSRLDYRFTVTEDEVRTAFQKARYYDRFVNDFQAQIRRDQKYIEVGNNHTPIRLRIPFSPNLTIKNLLDASMAFLGISLDSQSYLDLGTSARPRVSITINRYTKPFSMKVGELQIGPNDELELWITIIYSDDLTKDREPIVLRLSGLEMASSISNIDRRQETVRRFESYLQECIWQSVQRLVDTLQGKRP